MMAPHGTSRPSIDRNKIEGQKNVILNAEGFLKKHGFSLVGKRVLDVGCHAGIHSYLLAALGAAAVHGIDIPEYGIRQAVDMHVSADSMAFQSNLLGELRHCVSRYFSQEVVSRVSFDDISIEELDLRDEFDAVVSWQTLEHIENPGRAFERMFRALKSGGFCFHEYNPFFCHTGGHSLCTLDFLYGHCRLSATDFKRYIKQFRPEEEKAAIEFYEHSLNRMSIADLKSYIQLAGLKTVSFLPWISREGLIRFDGKVLRQIQANYPNVCDADLLATCVWVLIHRAM
jgi:SAM-dependent methyltransferase